MSDSCLNLNPENKSAMASSASVGLIVPPSNPTLETEIASLIDGQPQIHIARLPYCSTSDLAARNELYLESYLDAARSFGTLPLQGIMIGCTGSNYRLGPREDQRRCEAASAELGVPLLTASLAVLETIQTLGFTRIQLELPYPDWLIKLAVDYWQAAGFEVVAQHSLLDLMGADNAYTIGTQSLERYLLELQVPAGTAVLLSGTGMPTFSAMAELIQTYPAPLISSNLCIAQWLLRCCQNSRGTDLQRQLGAKLERFSAIPAGAVVDNLFNPFGSIS
jgi:maleate isomerase